MSGPDPELEEARRHEAARWLSIAAGDADVAALCLETYEPRLSAAAYHCQQALEKLMKGLLVLANIPFSKTHDLRTIGASVIRHYPDWEGPVSATFSWTFWGYAYRYPGPEDYDLPTPEELQMALSTFSRMIRMARPLVCSEDRER